MNEGQAKYQKELDKHGDLIANVLNRFLEATEPNDWVWPNPIKADRAVGVHIIRDFVFNVFPEK